MNNFKTYIVELQIIDASLPKLDLDHVVSRLDPSILKYITQFSMAKDGNKLWVTMISSSESQLLSLIDVLPGIYNYDIQYTELDTSMSLMHFNNSLTPLDR